MLEPDNRCSKISGDQIVRPFATTRIHSDRSCVNQVAVQIKRVEKSSLIEPHIGLNLLQRIFIHEKRSLHGAVVPPKTHGTPRCVIRSALIRKIERHSADTASEPTMLSAWSRTPKSHGVFCRFRRAPAFSGTRTEANGHDLGAGPRRVRGGVRLLSIVESSLIR
jgi:hypothetical protein